MIRIKELIFLLTLSLPFLGLGQTENTDTVLNTSLDSIEIYNESKISLTFYSGITSVHNYISPSPVHNTLGNFKEFISPIDFTIEANYSFSQKMGISFGLKFSYRKEGVDYLPIIGTGYSEYPYGYSEWANQSNTFIYGVPVLLTSRFNLNRIMHVLLSTGAQMTYFDHELRYTIPHPDISSQKYRKFGISGILRPELRFVIKRCALGFFVKGSYDFVNAITWESINRHRFEFGIGSSVSFYLSKGRMELNK